MNTCFSVKRGEGERGGMVKEEIEESSPSARN